MISMFTSSDKGVSPVIGVILMVAITVILAAVIGAFVIGLGENVNEEVTAGVTVDEADDGVIFRYNSEGNAEQIKILSNGSEVAQLNSIGDSATVAVEDGDTITVVGVTNEQQTTLRTYNATQKLGSTNSFSVFETIDTGTEFDNSSGSTPETVTYTSAGARLEYEGSSGPMQVVEETATYTYNVPSTTINRLSYNFTNVPADVKIRVLNTEASQITSKTVSSAGSGVLEINSSQDNVGSIQVTYPNTDANTSSGEAVVIDSLTIEQSSS